MYIILLFIVIGIATGYLFRKQKNKFVNYLITFLIWLLLFLLGMEVGLNEQVLKKFHLLGIEAFIIAFFATLGSVIGAWLLWKNNSESNQ